MRIVQSVFGLFSWPEQSHSWRCSQQALAHCTRLLLLGGEKQRNPKTTTGKKIKKRKKKPPSTRNSFFVILHLATILKKKSTSKSGNCCECFIIRIINKHCSTEVRKNKYQQLLLPIEEPLPNTTIYIPLTLSKPSVNFLTLPPHFLLTYRFEMCFWFYSL